MKYYIENIINRNTGCDSCIGLYRNKPIQEVIHTQGLELCVRFKDGSFFTHEMVRHVERQGNSLRIVTDAKIWRLRELEFSDVMFSNKFNIKSF